MLSFTLKRTFEFRETTHGRLGLERVCVHHSMSLVQLYLAVKHHGGRSN